VSEWNTREILDENWPVIVRHAPERNGIVVKIPRYFHVIPELFFSFSNLANQKKRIHRRTIHLEFILDDEGSPFEVVVTKNSGGQIFYAQIHSDVFVVVLKEFVPRQILNILVVPLGDDLKIGIGDKLAQAFAAKRR
jgi:hypothetical protein